MLYLNKEQIQFAAGLICAIGDQALCYVNRKTGEILVAPNRGTEGNLASIVNRALGPLQDSVPGGIHVGLTTPEAARRLSPDYISFTSTDDIPQVI
jgi:hypothetical protein